MRADKLESGRNCRVGRVHRPAQILFMPSINLYCITYWSGGIQLDLTKEQALDAAEVLNWGYEPSGYDGWGYYKYIHKNGK